MITPEQVDDVLNYFYNNNDNRSSVISKVLNIKLWKVDYIIDFHLSLKENYISEPLKVQKTIHKNSKSIIVTDDDNNFIGEFISIKECSKQLNVNHCSISNFLRGFNSGKFIKHHNGKTYNYSIVNK